MLGAPPPLISSASVFHCYPSCCSPIFLTPAAHHQCDHVIRQRPLQRLGLIPWRAHPHVPYFVGGQDHRHGLGMDRLDDRVRRRRQKAVDQVRAGDRFRFRPIALELGPDAGEAGQRPIIINREPDDILFLGLRVRLRRVFGEAVERDQAAVFWLQPAVPVQR